ncbi:DUF3263 domain-containing protein [Mycolicibacterium litorale]|uniref:DUF3263 domain-containing protein n=1 Tax=Mycolicibacterium litorale TaxID=758802 RepID=UPI003CF890D2
MALDSLTDTEIAMLDLEEQWYTTAGRKEDAIDEQLGLKPVRYYQLLNRLVERQAALAYTPITVNRLRRLRTGASSTHG